MCEIYIYIYIYIFVIVIIFFVYEDDRYGTAATYGSTAKSGAELLLTIIYRFQSQPFVIGVLVWDVLAVPDPPVLLYYFSVNNIMVCSKVSFS